MKVALYCRSSINSQEHSIDMQKAIADEITMRRSLFIDEIYIDQAVSARNTDIHERPEFHRLWKDIERGHVKTLLVYKRDRLARNVKQHLEIFEFLKNHGVEVIFTAGNEFPLQYTPAGEFLELVMAGFNEREANQIAYRIKETKQALFLMGKNHSGRTPFGYFIDKEKELQPNSAELTIVINVFNQLLSEKWESFSDFVRALEANGTITLNKSNYQKVKKMIQTPEYMGIRKAKFLEETIELEQERLAVLSESDWNEANVILNSLITSRSDS